MKVDIEKPCTTLSAKTKGQQIANDSRTYMIVGRVCWTDRGWKGRLGGCQFSKEEVSAQPTISRQGDRRRSVERWRIETVMWIAV